MLLASVILDIPTQALEGSYTYVVPPHATQAEIGCAVLVPFGPRRMVGFVVDLKEVSDIEAFSKAHDLDVTKLKEVHSVLSAPYFDKDGARCAQFLSKTYIAPLSSCVRLFVPPGGVPRMVRSGSGWYVEEPSIGPVDDRWVRLCEGVAFEPKRSAVKQRAIIDALRAGDLRVAELSVELGSISSSLNALAKKGIVELFRKRRMRGVTEDEGAAPFTPSPKPVLTAGQKTALDVIAAAQTAACGEVILLDGVTGSGKTEVYLQAIEETLAQGRNAIVLVPEIALTPQTVARFRGRFGDGVAVMHSRMGQGERYDQWDYVRSGRARVVVGARSALFVPLADLGLIVIDEEHESSYKQESAPRYVSRDVAAWMVKRRGATLVLGSATPSLEALYRCKTEEAWHYVELPERANGKPLPRIEVVDMALEFGGGHRSMFSQKLTNALKEEMEAGHKAVLLLNQRGFAQFLLCRACGFVPQCPSCTTSLTYHEKGSTLVCHHCGYEQSVPVTCPECASPYLKKFGAGTQRVEAELRTIFEEDQATIIRMDADTTKGKGAHQRLLESFGAAEAAILLGTQMIAKGLDYDDVTLVGVINADTMLRLPDFRSAERTFDLIQQVAGRAGRAHLHGRVFVQTYWAEAPAVRAAAAYDRAAFLADELMKRGQLGYPPYTRLANVLIWGEDEAEVIEAARTLTHDIEARLDQGHHEGWVCLPATSCVLARLRGSYRYHIVIKAPQGSDPSEVLLPVFRSRKAAKTVNVAVDIDPYDML